MRYDNCHLLFEFLHQLFFKYHKVHCYKSLQNTIVGSQHRKTNFCLSSEVYTQVSVILSFMAHFSHNLITEAEACV